MVFDFEPPQTPALVIDRAALMRNLQVMQSACDAGGLRLRPHGKMHKCSTLGRLQIDLGAVGLCCQTVGEAEAFARAGIADLLVSAALPSWGPPRLAALAFETGATIAAVCDSTDQIERLSAAAAEHGVTLGALVDIDIGMRRAGCAPKEAPSLAGKIVNSRGLRYGGVQAYFGRLQHLEQGRAEANAEATGILKAIVAELTVQGLAPPCVTGGGTGTYVFDIAAAIFTELQCGSYAVMDAEYQTCGGPDGDWPFHPALHIAASVVSAKHESHVTTDAGFKASSADVPPRVVAGATPDSQWRSLGDEHGAIIPPPGGMLPKEGDIVWLQPGHCDPTINLYDGFWVVDESGVADFWPIDARRVSCGA